MIVTLKNQAICAIMENNFALAIEKLEEIEGVCSDSTYPQLLDAVSKYDNVTYLSYKNGTARGFTINNWNHYGDHEFEIQMTVINAKRLCIDLAMILVDI